MRPRWSIPSVHPAQRGLPGNQYCQSYPALHEQGWWVGSCTAGRTAFLDCCPQGRGRQAYRDVFTACPGTRFDPPCRSPSRSRSAPTMQIPILTSGGKKTIHASTRCMTRRGNSLVKLVAVADRSKIPPQISDEFRHRLDRMDAIDALAG